MTGMRWEGEREVGNLIDLVRSTYAETLPAGDARGLARLEEAWHRARTPPQTRRLRLVGAAMATVVALGIGAAAFYRAFDRLSYQVVNGSIGAGGLVRANGAGTTILFSEGSEIVLGEAARARVDGMTRNGGRFVLENGSVHARIVPRKHARWSVEAGPYTIRVTGTAFKVKWSWTDERLDLRMDHGSVIVSGPLAPAGVTLIGGMSLAASPRSGLTIGGVGEPPAVPTPQAASDTGTPVNPAFGSSAPGTLPDEAPNGETIPPSDELMPGADGAAQTLAQRFVGAGAPVRRAAAHRFGHPAARSSQAWERLLARGEVQGILDDAELRGIDEVLVAASEGDLTALADAARYGHRPALARRALLSLRKRFPRSAETRETAFFLGGLAEDAVESEDHARALEWYDRYLAENQRGRYVAHALGRKMVMTDQLKGAAVAAPLAADYLRRFPGGPYASAARQLLQSP